jgi:hypothetical protein
MDSEPLKLGKGHRRALTSRLRVMDEMLAEAERWARGEEAGGVMVTEHNDLSAEQRRRLVQEVPALRRVIAELREAGGLPVEQHSVRQAIASRCSLLWEMLIELEPKYLRRYGALEEASAEFVEQKVEELQQGVEALRRHL